MPERLNLTGMQFGQLRVIEFAGSNKHQASTWKCVCSCGKEIIVIGALLTRGGKISCGCHRAHVDISGKRFGRWTVIRRSDPDNQRSKDELYYYCLCDCGNYKDVYGPNIVNGKSLSCGCLGAELASERGIKDLTGKTFTRLTVVERAGINRQGNSEWRCLCTCGAETVVSSTNLLTNHTTSCGCLGRERAAERRTFNIIGEKHNSLTAIEYIGRNKRGEQLWRCRCDCGGEKIVTTAGMRFGAAKHCERCSHEARVARNTTHGMTGTREYNRMRNRQRKERRKKLDVNWNYEKERALREFYKSCVVCGDTKDLQVDHVRPLDKGYGLEPGNATILCKYHNDKKKAKMPETLPEPMRSLILDSAAEFKEYWEWLQGGAR